MSNDSREAFEKWHLENYGFTPSSQNQVNDSIPADRWRVWQACEAQHKQKVLELVEKFTLTGNDTMAHLINKHFGE